MNYNLQSSVKLVLTCLVSTTLISSYANTEQVKDSVGVKREAGKTYVLYKVGSGQTLFSIVRKYGSSMADYKAANPGGADNIKIGEIIKVPYKGAAIASSVSIPTPHVPVSVPTTPAPEAVKMVTHVVETGQGLYGIATKHKVTMSDIRKWNSLTSDQLTVGQVLIVDAKEYERAKKMGELPVKGEIVKVEDTETSKAVPATSKTEEPISSDTKTSSETTKTNSGYKKTFETGLAELIDVEDKSGKYLALHRSAPVGTLVNVKNASNGQSIWVKVIGKLPDIGSDRVIIKLSPRAFEKLNPSDKRIRAEISYMTP